ncbi:MAG: chromosome segregation protein SMC [Fimbriimonadaceae bacterium]|nr:chromosome segregation protein SMC [Fimbriimonadaceae bacterium]
MRLKRVSIYGFKTFADKTEIDLRGDLIAVVGPNGCGKSNIVDAILWGLGEPNARQLRAQTGTDVIFAGSSRRRALGFAEVSLYFDNEDGSLPVSTREVVVTRKLARSGDAAYSINRAPCRLRDLYDLLADSGLGKSGYAIVGQKEIDQALAASPEERRAWVDEAAGVQRYRQRKQESFRRLSSADEHLARVRDILREVEAQREPLREDAEVARRYRGVLESLRRIEVGLLARQVVELRAEIDELENRIRATQTAGERESALAEAEDRRAEKAQQDLRRIEDALTAARAEQHRLATEIERHEAEIRLNEQRERGLDELESQLREDAAHAESRLSEAEAESAQRKEESAEATDRLERLREETAGAGDEAKAIRAELKALDDELEQARRAHADWLKRNAEEAHREERVREIAREVEGIDASLPELVAGVEEAEGTVVAVDAEIAAIEARVAKLQKELADRRKEDARAAEEDRGLLGRIASLEGRHRAIEYTLESHEGLNQGARAVLDAVQKGLLKGEYVPVGQAVDTERKYAVAVETALGAAANDLITPDEPSAKRAIEYLKADRLGRATFQPLTLVHPHPPSRDLEALLRRPGVQGRASDLVKTKARFQSVIESLLGRILVVDDLDVAFSLAKTPGWSRVVTLEGEVLHSGGAVTGGATVKQSFGMVQRRAELVELEKQIATLQKARKASEKAGAERAKREADGLSAIDAANRELAAVRPRHREASRWASEVRDELESTRKSRERLVHEAERLGSRAAPADRPPDLAGIETRREDTLQRLAARSADAEQSAARLRESEERASQAELLAEQAARRLQALRDGEAARSRRLASMAPERTRLAEDRTRLAAEIERLRFARKEEDARFSETVERRKEAEAAAEDARAKARAARSAALAASEAVHQAELARARSDARRAAAAQRLVEEYSLDESAAQGVLDDLAPDEIPADAERLVAKLRRELRDMGDVNLGAIEAYERLTERADELAAQVDDVTRGIEEIRKGIGELDRLTRDRFVDTFAKVQAAFEETFLRMFEGGSGQLGLSRADNILESGIEIDVQLPGKKKQKLELLSGGERSLCATAFLFALLRVKPSPLVVLDEVDAPLDGRNVERFIDMLKSFAATTQFIVITHNPTTIEASSVWLGVTMQEPGVTTVIPCSVPVEASGQRMLPMG